REETSLNNEVSFYQDHMNNTITLVPAHTLKNTELFLFNLMGQRIYSESLGDFSGQHQISMNYPAGIYFLKLHTGEGILTKKIMNVE
ncbi:MAG: T9SS type A sorting domain-containing protein, partial [Bacteroidetes bacterium]|nr:T9SS type A sorting domain-containing protein [Bacteroidota bacterium]